MFKKKRKKKEKEYLNDYEFQAFVSKVHQHTFMFIGLCLIFIAVLSLIIGIPTTYISSFSIAGFIFSFVDLKSQFEKQTKNDTRVIFFLFILGFFCLIVLPIILTQIPLLEMIFTEFAEYISLLGVALVMIAINYNRVRAENRITVNKEEWEEYQKILKDKMVEDK